MKIETKIHFAADLRGKLAQDVINYSLIWQNLFKGNMDEEGLQVMQQSWDEWSIFLIGFDLGYQSKMKGEDLNEREVAMTMQLLDAILKTLEKDGHYQKVGK